MNRKSRSSWSITRGTFKTILVILLGCMAAGSSWADARYKIIEVPTGQRLFDKSSSYERSLEARGLAWLDDHRLMFVGYTPVRPESPRRLYSDIKDLGIYIWDTESGQVSRYGSENSFCYADGWIHMQEAAVDGEGPDYLRPSWVNYRFGPLGKERSSTCTVKYGKQFNCPGKLDMSCKPAEYVQSPADKRPLGKESFIVAWLRSGDGVVVNPIDSRRSSSQEERRIARLGPLLLINKKHPRGRPIDIQIGEGIWNYTYSDYARKYVLVTSRPKNNDGSSQKWAADVPQPVYLMDHEGQMETVPVPKLAVWQTIFDGLPTRAGLAFNGTPERTGGGLFLFDGKQVETLDLGQLHTLAVSRDGCKLAWAIINDYKHVPMDHRIKFTNVCTGGT